MSEIESKCSSDRCFGNKKNAVETTVPLSLFCVVAAVVVVVVIVVVFQLGAKIVGSHWCQGFLLKFGVFEKRQVDTL